MNVSEFDLIARIRQHVVARDDVVLGIGDDAAVLAMPAGVQLVVAMDTLNEGVHFPRDTAPYDIGWKALAVNLSDLAAMGATPAWCTLSLSLPEADAAWLDAFCEGFAALARLHRIALVGGDTTRGPLSVCVTVHGFVEPGRALARGGAREGDDVWVSGTLGDAAAGLLYALDDASAPRDASSADVDALRARLDRPTPRVALGRALVGVAHACIDVSDGLVADLSHLCRASRVAATVQCDALPASDALMHVLHADRRITLQASGGDDYELCFTAPADARDALRLCATDVGVHLTRIGTVEAGSGVSLVDRDGVVHASPVAGYVHFASAGRSVKTQSP